MTHRLFSAALMVALFSSVTCVSLRAESLLTPTCVHHGDVSLDGNISAGDAQMAFSIVLGTYTPTYEEECAADCTADGMVTAGDAQSIFYAVLGIGECADPLDDRSDRSPTLPKRRHPLRLRVAQGVIWFQPIRSSATCGVRQPGLSRRDHRTTNLAAAADETQFTHTLTRNLAVMETEITRQMWADLQAVQPTFAG